MLLSKDRLEEDILVVEYKIAEQSAKLNELSTRAKLANKLSLSIDLDDLCSNANQLSESIGNLE